MSLHNSAKRVLLCICDGMGHSENQIDNAVLSAKTPNLDHIYKTYPFTTITAGGESVGLPSGVSGNSEVGHMNLGAGRSIRQDLVRINESIESGTLKDMPMLKELINHAKKGSKKVHLLTLLSDGGVHAHIDHLKAVLKILKLEKGLEVYLHAFMDGRDTPKKNGQKYIDEISKIKGHTFASMQGRSLGMDRDNRWEKIEKSYKTLTGKGRITELDPTDYLQNEYTNEIYDEFITPVLFNKESRICKDDCVFFLNFRSDRARQITLAFCDQNFSHFENKIRPKHFLCMSPSVEEECPDLPILFNRENIKNGLSEHLSNLRKKQFKIAETEKYAHVTYFFNGGRTPPFALEQRCLIDSPKDVATYDERPQMSALEVKTKLIEKLKDPSISFYVVNFANPDMIGHTGNFSAAIKAMEVMDTIILELKETCLEHNISMIITADHGNCDQMSYEDGGPHTSHTNAQVPFCLIQKGLEDKKVMANKNHYSLKNVSPTILHLLGIETTKEMSKETIFS